MFNTNEIIVRFNENTYIKELRPICDVYPIVPAGKIKKSWWKIMKTHYDIFLSQRTKELKTTGQTMKYCPGVYDFTNYGYIVPAWQDFQFWVNDDGSMEWHVPYNMKGINNIEAHGNEKTDTCPILGDSADQASLLKLISPWYISSPKGTSLLICKPFYHYSNDFDVCPGVLDNDINRIGNQSLNAFIRFNVKNKVIHIKAGQPLIQIIPFKRTNWKLKQVEVDKNFRDMSRKDGIIANTRFQPELEDKDSLTKYRHDNSNKKFE